MGSLELGLKEFEIIQRYDSDDYYKFAVRRNEEPFFCTLCMDFQPFDGSWKFKYHDTRKRTVIDERLRRKKVVLEVHQRRYNCPSCGGRFPEFIECISPFDKVTRRLWETLGNEALKGNYREIGEYFGVSDTTVHKAFDALIAEKDKNRVLIAPKVLGIDEVYVKLEKGKKKEGCAVFTDVENHKIIEFIRGTTKDVVIPVIQSLKGYENIEIVTMDMNSGYRNAVKDTIPKAYCVVDHFHVIQKCNDIQKQLDLKMVDIETKAGKNKLLKAELPQLERDRADIYKVRIYLKMGREMLDADQAKKLKAQLEKYPNLNACYWLKEGLRDVYDCKVKRDAYQLFYKWECEVKDTHKKLPIPEMMGILRMITRIKNEVFAYFDGRYTNAYAESL
jgi:transposase